MPTLESDSNCSLSLSYLPWTVNPREIFECAHLKFTVSGRSKQASKQASNQANIQTHVCNAVTLVWGSLRLAPITAIKYDRGTWKWRPPIMHSQLMAQSYSTPSLLHISFSLSCYYILASERGPSFCTCFSVCFFASVWSCSCCRIYNVHFYWVSIWELFCRCDSSS